MAKKAQPPPKNFEDALAELERILAEIEGGKVGLEESLVKYERGTFLIQHCRGVLSSAEKQIEVLTRSSEGQTGPTSVGSGAAENGSSELDGLEPGEEIG